MTAAVTSRTEPGVCRGFDYVQRKGNVTVLLGLNDPDCTVAVSPGRTYIAIDSIFKIERGQAVPMNSNRLTKELASGLDRQFRIWDEEGKDPGRETVGRAVASIFVNGPIQEDDRILRSVGEPRAVGDAVIRDLRILGLGTFIFGPMGSNSYVLSTTNISQLELINE